MCPACGEWAESMVSVLCLWNDPGGGGGATSVGNA